MISDKMVLYVSFFIILITTTLIVIEINKSDNIETRNSSQSEVDTTIHKSIETPTENNPTKGTESKSSEPIIEDSRCTICYIGIVHNGICDRCNAASEDKVRQHKENLNNKIEQDPYLKHQYECPACYGSGCNNCGYKGYRTPYDM